VTFAVVDRFQHGDVARIPAVTIGGGGQGGNWHSRNEWYRPTDAWYGRKTRC